MFRTAALPRLLPTLSRTSAISMKSAGVSRSLSTTQVFGHREVYDRRFTNEKSLRRNPFRMERHVKHNHLAINKRQEQVAFDQENRYGAQVVPRRSDFLDWNYSAELAAFQARLGESFDDEQLRKALVTRDYLETQHLKEKSLGLVKTGEQDSSSESSSSSSSSDSENSGSSPSQRLTPKDVEFIEANSNVEMVLKGEDVIEEVVLGYARAALPSLPEEGVHAILAHLTTDQKLAHVSFHIGTMDLVLTQEYPPSVKTMADAFKALVWALWQSPEQGQERTKRLLVDVLATQLHGKDINDIWNVEDPMGAVATILKNQGKPEPEARLMWVSGQGSIMACYHIGIYAGQELIGQAPGETAEIAEDMAARDVLRRMFKYEDSSKPLPFSRELISSAGASNTIQLKDSPNLKIANWSPDKIPQTISIV